MIPEEHKEQLVYDSLNLVSTICKAYGAEEGIKLWENIAVALDPELKGLMFTAMLGGFDNTKLVIKGLSSWQTKPSKVSFIRTIRQYTNLGLKEAKDICDAVESGTAMTIEIPTDLRRSAVSDLRNLGIMI